MSNKLIEKCEGAEVALFNLVLFDFLPIRIGTISLSS